MHRHVLAGWHCSGQQQQQHLNDKCPEQMRQYHHHHLLLSLHPKQQQKMAFVCVSVYTLQILHSVTISGWVDGWRRAVAGACWCWLPFDCWWHCCSLFSFLLLLLLPLLLPIYHGHLGSTLPAQAHTHLHTLCSSVCLFALALSLSFLPFFLPNHHHPPPTANCTVPVSVTLWCCCFRLAGCFQNLLFFPLSLSTISRPALSNAIVWILVLFISPSLYMLLVHSFTPLACAKMWRHEMGFFFLLFPFFLFLLLLFSTALACHFPHWTVDLRFATVALVFCHILLFVFSIFIFFGTLLSQNCHCSIFFYHLSTLLITFKTRKLNVIN